MKTIKTDSLKEGIKNFMESFRESNDDVKLVIEELHLVAFDNVL